MQHFWKIRDASNASDRPRYIGGEQPAREQQCFCCSSIGQFYRREGQARLARPVCAGSTVAEPSNQSPGAARCGIQKQTLTVVQEKVIWGSAAVWCWVLSCLLFNYGCACATGKDRTGACARPAPQAATEPAIRNPVPVPRTSSRLPALTRAIGCA